MIVRPLGGAGGLVRTGPGSNFSVIWRAKPGESFPVNGISTDQDYYRVIYDENSEGWIYSFFVRQIEGDLSSIPPISNVTASGYISRTLAALVRAGASADFEVIDKISDRWVTIVGKNSDSNYYLVNYACKSGWILSLFIDRIEGNSENLPVN